MYTITFIFYYYRIDDDDVIEKDGGHGSKLKLPVGLSKSKVIKKSKEIRLFKTKTGKAVVS